MRDTQRGRIYAAEREVYLASPRLETVAEMQRYVNHVTGLKWWTKRYGWRKVWIKDGRGRRSGACTNGSYSCTIKMPVWARYEVYLLHELAHAATNGSARNEPPHGGTFAFNYLTLVKRFAGQEPFEALLAGFREHGVYWKGAVG